MKDASKILSDGKMISQASYYSGRGETRSDLNGEMVESMFQDIQKNNGADAAASFVNTVADLYFVHEDLSAAGFINAMYTLEEANWRYSPAVEPKTSADTFAQAASHDLQHGKGSGGIQGGLLTVFSNGSGKKDIYARKSIGQNFLMTRAELLQPQNLERAKAEASAENKYPQVQRLQAKVQL